MKLGIFAFLIGLVILVLLTTLGYINVDVVSVANIASYVVAATLVLFFVAIFLFAD